MSPGDQEAAEGWQSRALGQRQDLQVEWIEHTDLDPVQPQALPSSRSLGKPPASLKLSLLVWRMGRRIPTPRVATRAK